MLVPDFDAAGINVNGIFSGEPMVSALSFFDRNESSDTVPLEETLIDGC